MALYNPQHIHFGNLMNPRYRALLFFAMTLACVGSAMAGEPIQARTAADELCFPEWPAASVQNEENGTVALLVLVSPDGKVMDAKISKSSGSRDLDKATLVAAGKCKFIPAVSDGVAVASWFGLRQQWRAGVRPTAFPQKATCEKPEWPKASLRNSEQGTVNLAFLVDENGKVIDSRIDKSSGFPLLDAAAQTGIGKCTFKPASVDGKAVEKWVTMQYVWSLR